MAVHARSKRVIWRAGMVALTAGLLAAGCGDDDEATNEQATTTEHHDDGEISSTVAAQANACPTDGCVVQVVSVARVGDELELEFDANFLPDISRNHFHVFWDQFTSEQVSSDAQTRFGVAQGAWVATADNPYTTGDATSVTTRGASTRICVTAGDRHHNVVDPKLTDCRDVSEFL